MLKITQIAEKSFKARFGNHHKDFNNEQCKKFSELSKYMWSVKEDQIMSRIRWSVVEKVLVEQKLIFAHYA